MSNLKFNQLLVLSHTLKAGNQFKFPKRLTLITANDNSVGKSTLVKIIYWALGCEPFLDSTWKNCDSRAILDFSIDSSKYRVHRYQDNIYFKEIGKRYKEYSKITGAYSVMLAKLLKFHAKLPARESDELETPPPAYYFSPYYIDQKKSWAIAWENFDKLGQYSAWKSTIIKSHTGLLPQEHFEIEEEIYGYKASNKVAKDSISKLEIATEIINTHVPKSNLTIEPDELELMTDKVRVELKELSLAQENFLEKISEQESERHHVTQQIILTEKIILELDSDYKFAVENIHDDTFDCPLCGVSHQNSIVNRASILTDKQKAEEQLKDLEKALNIQKNRVVKTSKELKRIRAKIDELNSKYSIKKKNQSIPLSEIINTIASSTIQSKIEKTKEIKVLESDDLQTKIKNCRKEQRLLLDKEDKERISTFFSSKFLSFVESLDALGLNISQIKGPLDYNKIIVEGGAAEGIRGILAYYLTIFSMIREFGSEVISPLVVDTPNQHEQSILNYDKIIDILTNKLPSDSQIILCAMENDKLGPFKDKAHIITLDENRILLKEKYDKLKDEFLLH